MSDLINRKKLYNYLNDWAFGIAPDERHEGTERLIRQVRYETIQECMSVVEDLPSAQRKGKWIRITQGAMPEQYICPFCHRTVEAYGVEELLPIRYPYCHCGADMRGEEE